MIILRQREYVNLENVPVAMRRSYLSDRNNIAKSIRRSRRYLDRTVGNDPIYRDQSTSTALDYLKTARERLKGKYEKL